MASEKLKRALYAMGAPFTEEELETLDEAHGWRWVYAHTPKRPKRGPEVCFTGFKKNERLELEALARAAGWEPVGSVTVSLKYLCTGFRAGPNKVQDAIDAGIEVGDREAFEARLGGPR